MMENNDSNGWVTYLTHNFQVNTGDNPLHMEK